MKRRERCQKNNLKIYFDRGLDPRTRICCLKFFKWLRVRFLFPHPVNIFIMNQEMIKSLDGERVYGACFIPDDNTAVSIASASKFLYSPDYCANYANLTGILHTITHEIGHYFDWIDRPDIDVQSFDEEYADDYSRYMLELYLPTHAYLYPGAKKQVLKSQILWRNITDQPQRGIHRSNIHRVVAALHHL